MEHPGFFDRTSPQRLSAIAQHVGATIPDGYDPSQLITDIRPLDEAIGGHLSFLDNRKYLGQLDATRATAVLIAPIHMARVPAGITPLLLKTPYRGFAQALALFYPDAMRPKAAMSEAGAPLIHPSARIEQGVRIEPGAVIGRDAWIGEGATIAAGAVIGYRVTVGRQSYVGPCASIIHALIRRSYRPGWFRLRHGPRRPPQGSPDWSGDRPERRGNRRQ
jgi:UDP-3-O-[3-hydroxymyristoyl] glucosamine N-acyltransferase